MKNILQYLQGWMARIDRLSLRERAFILVASAFALISLVSVVLINPTLTRQKNLSDHILQTQQLTTTLNKEIQILLQQNHNDPNVQLKAKLAALHNMSEQNVKMLNDIQSHLVRPEQMPAMLETLLNHNHGVHLISLSTMSVETLGDNHHTPDKTDLQSPANGPTTATPDQTRADAMTAHIYKHGIEIILSGSYSDLVQYMKDLESAPWRMFWGKVKLTVDDEHNLQLTLRLYTISQDQAWLSI